MGQTPETSGGVRMMRGRDEVLWCVSDYLCVCVCGQCNQRCLISFDLLDAFHSQCHSDCDVTNSERPDASHARLSLHNVPLCFQTVFDCVNSCF